MPRSGEPLAGAEDPPQADRDGQAAGDHRRVVEQRPVEVGLPRDAARAERRVEVDDHDDEDLDDGDEVHPLVLVAQRPGSRLEPAAHPPAQEDRDDVGQVQADHADRHDRGERHGHAVLVALQRRAA